MRLPSMSSLQVISALRRLETATAVAQELGITQSAVSRQIQSLEHLVGATLVKRVRQRLVFTEEGLKFSQDAEDILAQVHNALHTAQGKFAPNTVTLGILPAFGMRWVMPKLAQFAESFPAITINMLTVLSFSDLRTDQLDAAIVYGQSQTRYKSLLLQKETLIPVCSPEILGTLDRQDISTWTVLSLKSRQDEWRDWQTEIALEGLPKRGAIYDQFATLMQGVQMGLGVGLLPKYLVDRALETDQLVALHPPTLMPDRGYFLIWEKASRNQGLRAFVQWIERYAEHSEDLLPR